MVLDEAGGAALVELVTKGGGTFVGAIGALGLLWKVALAPLATRLLDMHEKMANAVANALRDHAESLRRISDRIEKIEGKIENYLHQRVEPVRRD